MRLRISPITGLSFDLMRQPSAVQSATANIRRSGELVNEMGIQFFLGDASALLCGTQKANRTIFASDEGAVVKSRMYAGPTRIQAASQMR
jgi:hypothetical protein